MPDKTSLGRLIAVHPISPAYLQRAVILAALALTFFFGMMFAFYLLQNFVYFLLASAFLMIYLATMASFFTARKKSVEVHEKGLRIGRESILWGDIDGVSEDGEITSKTTRKVTAIASSIVRRAELLIYVKTRIN